MTQKQPADKLGVSDKAVSKWERGLGCPDITLVTELSEILSVSLESLLSGSTETSDFKEVNMKRQPVFTPIDISAPNIGGTLSSASHFYLIKSHSGIICIPPPNGTLKPLDGTIQTKKRLGYPNRFCLVSTKNTAQNLNGVWCERWDLNPHVKDTRTSNVPVCLFQHSRIFSDLFNQSAFIL